MHLVLPTVLEKLAKENNECGIGLCTLHMPTKTHEALIVGVRVLSL